MPPPPGSLFLFNKDSDAEIHGKAMVMKCASEKSGDPQRKAYTVYSLGLLVLKREAQPSEHWLLFSTSHFGWLSTTKNSSSCDLTPSSGLPHSCTHMYSSHTHMIKYKNKKLEG